MLPISEFSGDRYKTCPFNSCHVILAKGYDAHITSCPDSHRCRRKKEVCTLDHTHVIRKGTLKDHLKDCPKRYLMDRELQMRAGDTGLKGDVVGPRIVADHLAGKDVQEEENWDNEPQHSSPTPALFNKKKKKTPKKSNGATSGAAYLPPQADELEVRKVPHHPAKAATMSNPAAAQIRPSHNPASQFSDENNHPPRMDGDPTTSPPASVQAAAVAPGAPNGMTAPRGQASAPNHQSPRFSGRRGASKCATKSNQRPVASPPASFPASLAPQSPPDGDRRGEDKNFARRCEDSTANRSPNNKPKYFPKSSKR